MLNAPNAAPFLYGEEYTGILPGGFPQKAIRDTTRNKWLSTNLTSQEFSRRGSVDNSYLATDNNPCRDSGFLMPANGTIVMVTIRISGGDTTKEFHLRRNGVASDILTFQLSGSNTLVVDDVNFDFNSSDWLSVFADPGGTSVENPVFTIWYAWRF